MHAYVYTVSPSVSRATVRVPELKSVCVCVCMCVCVCVSYRGNFYVKVAVMGMVCDSKSYKTSPVTAHTRVQLDTQ